MPRPSRLIATTALFGPSRPIAATALPSRADRSRSAASGPARARLAALASLSLSLVASACDPTSADPSQPADDTPSAAAAIVDDDNTHTAIAHAHGSPDGDELDADPDAEGASALVHLVAPPMRTVSEAGRYQAVPATATDRVGLAFQFDAPVFRLPSAARKISGIVRRNTAVAIDRWVPGDGCDKSWYALLGGGFVCTSDGFNVSAEPTPLPEPLQVVPPAPDQALPYRYAKLETPAPLYWRLPTERELAANASAPVREQATGAHFVAIDATHTVGETTLLRTVRGMYVREADTKAIPTPTMHGAVLSEAQTLPLAFVHVDQASLLDPESGQSRGTADKFARFAVAQQREHDGKTLVVSPDGWAAPRDQVRIAAVQARPEEVGADDQWIHIDLSQQVLVAYEGDTPVLATMVSSGKEGFTPPLGLFRVHKKYTTVTMSGPDPDAGTYAVEEVPWTMYYWGSYAVHGAYWHDTFGNVRSHGCTNVPPIDAHWLFYWAKPSLEAGWHAEVGLRGPWVYFTNGTARGEAGAADAPAPEHGGGY